MFHRKMCSFLMLLLLPFFFAGCLRTAAQIEKDQEIEDMVGKWRQTNSLIADLTSKNKELQEQLATMQGRIDDLQQTAGKNQASASHSQINSEQQLKLSADVEDLKKQVSKIQEDLDAQQEYIKKTSAILQGMTTTPTEVDTFKKKDKKLNKSDSLTVDAMEDHLRNKKYDDVIQGCKTLLTEKISDGKKNRCRYAMGVAYKEQKSYDESLLSLSQIYTDWPKSSLAPNSLFVIAEILKEKGQKKEAQLMLKKLVKEYPKSSAAKDAQGLMKP